MNASNLQVLPIESELQLKLIKALEQFESYRVHNDIDKIVPEEKQNEDMPVAKKKKRTSFLERLFITEYNE